MVNIFFLIIHNEYMFDALRSMCNILPWCQLSNLDQVFRLVFEANSGGYSGVFGQNLKLKKCHLVIAQSIFHISHLVSISKHSQLVSYLKQKKFSRSHQGPN